MRAGSRRFELVRHPRLGIRTSVALPTHLVPLLDGDDHFIFTTHEGPTRLLIDWYLIATGIRGLATPIWIYAFRFAFPLHL